MITGEELADELAEVSHQTWMRQTPLTDPDPKPTAHDRERASDIVLKLEELGLFPPPK